jgi:acyl carrier protein
MGRKEIEKHIVHIFQNEFEIENPENNVDLRETYGFDSIDAIELLAEIEIFLKFELTLDEKKQAMEIKTLNQIFDYVENMAKSRP